jgi:hypothetical protein
MLASTFGEFLLMLGVADGSVRRPPERCGVGWLAVFDVVVDGKVINSALVITGTAVDEHIAFAVFGINGVTASLAEDSVGAAATLVCKTVCNAVTVGAGSAVEDFIIAALTFNIVGPGTAVDDVVRNLPRPRPQRQTLARWTDGPALVRRRNGRGQHPVSPSQRPPSSSDTANRAPTAGRC